MRSARNAAFFLLACLPVAIAQAHADSSRQQVLEELARARASGDIEIAGELGGRARDRYPSLYPRTQAPGLAREAVRDELQAALRRGEVPRGDVDIVSGRAPALGDAAGGVAQGRTRAQVREELARAVLRGDIEEAGDGGRLLRDIYGRRYRGASEGAGSTTEYALASAR
jgi:hypothetical protein